MRRARVLGFGLLLGPWAACARDEAAPEDSDPSKSSGPAQDSSADAPPASDAITTPMVGAWVRVSQQRLLSAANVNARLELESEQPFRVAEVVAVEGEFVELRTLAAKPEDLCATTSGADPKFEIHFFAELDALEAVLAKPKLVVFDDGTKLELAAGVPVDLSGTEPSLRIGSASFIVPLAKHEISWWFPAAPAQPPATITSHAWNGARPLHYGERSIESDGPPFVDVHERRLLDDSSELLTFADACGRFTLRIIAGEVSASKRSALYEMKGPRAAIPSMARNYDPDMLARNAGILGALAEDEAGNELECGSQTFEAPSGAALTWQDSGKPAGVTRANVLLPKRTREMQGKRCFTTNDMAVCIASDMLVPKAAPACVRGPAGVDSQ